jgi:hypothetical protein
LRLLGHTVAQQTVKNVLIAAGIGPEPGDHADTWSEFLRRHAATLWQCDSASKRKWTITGMVDLYFLVFIHIGSRRMWVSPCTANPTGEWTAQQARNFDMFLQQENLPCTIVQRGSRAQKRRDANRIFSEPKSRPRSPRVDSWFRRSLPPARTPGRQVETDGIGSVVHAGKVLFMQSVQAPIRGPFYLPHYLPRRDGFRAFSHYFGCFSYHSKVGYSIGFGGSLAVEENGFSRSSDRDFSLFRREKRQGCPGQPTR